MKRLGRIAQVAWLAVFALLTTAAPVAAAGGVTIIVPISWYQPSQGIIDTFGVTFTSFYANIINLMIMIAFGFFIVKTFKVVAAAFTGTLTEDSGDGSAAKTSAFKMVKDLGAFGLQVLIVMFVAINGIDLMLSIASGTAVGLFSANMNDFGVNLFGATFAPMMKFAIDKGSMTIIVLGSAVMLWTAVKAIMSSEIAGGEHGKHVSGIAHKMLWQGVWIVVAYLAIRVGPSLLSQGVDLVKSLLVLG
jgi:hypothetical protein